MFSLKPYTSNKLKPKSSPCLFLGYSLNQSAYLCMDIQSRKKYTLLVMFTFLKMNFLFSTLSLSNSPIFYHNWFPSIDSFSNHAPMPMTMHQPLVQDVTDAPLYTLPSSSVDSLFLSSTKSGNSQNPYVPFIGSTSSSSPIIVTSPSQPVPSSLCHTPPPPTSGRCVGHSTEIPSCYL